MQEYLLKVLRNSKDYTLGVAEAMPEDAYGTKVVESSWNFNEQMNHIAYGIQWWESNSVKGIKMDWNPPAPKVGKKATIKFIHEAYDALMKTVSSSTSADGLFEGVHATMDHITHHRGQAVLYLRKAGITPPEYSF